MNWNWVYDHDWNGVVASWAGVIVATISLGIATIAFFMSLGANNKSRKLLERQIASEYVYWYVGRDVDRKVFILENLGANTAKTVSVCALVEDGTYEDRWQCGDIEPLGRHELTSENFFGDHKRLAIYWSSRYMHHFARETIGGNGTETDPLPVKFLIQWKDSFGFNSHQELTILFG